MLKVLLVYLVIVETVVIKEKEVLQVHEETKENVVKKVKLAIKDYQEIKDPLA